MLRRLLLAACLALVPSSAFADTFALTDGFINYYTGELGGASLIGDGLRVAGTTFGWGRIGVAPDQAVDWSGTYGFGGCGSATIRGVTYQGDLSDGCSGGIKVAATLQVSAVPFVPTADGAWWQTPFSLTGTIAGSTAAGAPLFAIDVTGEGRMAKDARTISSDLFLTGAPSLVLHEPISNTAGPALTALAVSPTPEPSTWMLVGTALAGFALTRRRQRGRAA